jgi:hypothetical protein
VNGTCPNIHIGLKVEEEKKVKAVERPPDVKN